MTEINSAITELLLQSRGMDDSEFNWKSLKPLVIKKLIFASLLLINAGRKLMRHGMIIIQQPN